jgi:hypothetical protein
MVYLLVYVVMHSSQLLLLADCYATLRDFLEKFDPKKFDKKKI